MRVRTVEEILKEIEETWVEYSYLFEYSNFHNDGGVWKHGNRLVLPEMRQKRVHIKNLQIELNRAKLKEWENRAKK